MQARNVIIRLIFIDPASGGHLLPVKNIIIEGMELESAMENHSCTTDISEPLETCGVLGVECHLSNVTSLLRTVKHLNQTMLSNVAFQ